MEPALDFWFEFASTYSYPAAARIADAAGRARVRVNWRPLLLGPIFGSQGWNDSPFNIYPVKGRYMWRDLEREAAALGLPFRRPNPFPQNSLAAARVAVYGLDHPWGVTFAKAVYQTEFGEGRSIAEPAAVHAILVRLGLDADSILKTAAAEPNKTRLKALTEQARSRGVFGAPTFFVGEQMFFGQDRLDFVREALLAQS